MASVKREDKGIVAIFDYFDDFCDVIKTIHHRQDFKDHEALSYTSYHELMDIAHEQYGDSPVKWFTLTGALLGVTTGFGMPLLMDYDWPLVVGGKTAGIYSLPAYVILGFELMILLGAIATIIGMLVMGRIPNPHVTIRDPRTMDDKFAVFVPCVDVESEQAKFLKQCGASEVYATAS
ncbi:MAG: DUF3341 domain-containing protein [Oligoflexales bacterium]